MNIFKTISNYIRFQYNKKSKNDKIEIPNYGEIYGEVIYKLDHNIYNKMEYHFNEYIYLNILEVNDNTKVLLNDYYRLLSICNSKYIHKEVDNKEYILIYINDDIINNINLLYLNDNKLMVKLLSSLNSLYYSYLQENSPINMEKDYNIDFKIVSFLNIIDSIHDQELDYLFEIFSYDEILSLSTVSMYINQNSDLFFRILRSTESNLLTCGNIDFCIIDILSLFRYLYSYNNNSSSNNNYEEEEYIISIFKNENYFKIENNYLYNKLLELKIFLNYNYENLYNDIDEEL